MKQLTSGGGAGTRTPDSADMSRMLYQLSYTAFFIYGWTKWKDLSSAEEVSFA